MTESACRPNGPSHSSDRLQRRRIVAMTLGAAFGATMLDLTGPAKAEAEDPIGKDLYIPDKIDHAIDRGIDSMLRHQNADGSIADRGHATAMTALAIMAFAAVGTIPDETDPRGRAMSRAIDFVLQERNQTEGYFGHRDGSRMYGHGIITLMLTEVLGMGVSPKQNEAIHDALDLALKVILKSQAVNKPPKLQGGWRYTPASRDSDLSVSVWQVMALRSAKNDGLEVPTSAIDLAVEYFKNSYTSPLDRDGVPRDPLGGFAYTPGTHHPTFTMTAAGLLAMQTCGQYDTPMVLGASKWLLEHPPRSKDRFFYYGIYYYAQGMHQVGGEAAKVATQLTSELLLDLQRDTGEWVGSHGEERNIGHVYSTTLAILSLSVRYHYLPIYQR